MIRHTKIIQFGQRQLLIPLAASSGSPLCPVAAITSLLANLKGVTLAKSQPLFTYVDVNGELKYLCHTSFVKLLRDILKLCSLDSSLYSGHSFRRGGCTFAFQLGISPVLIKLRGDWKSNAYERYITIQDDQHFKLAEVLSKSVL